MPEPIHESKLEIRELPLSPLEEHLFASYEGVLQPARAWYQDQIAPRTQPPTGRPDNSKDPALTPMMKRVLGKYPWWSDRKKQLPPAELPRSVEQDLIIERMKQLVLPRPTPTLNEIIEVVEYILKKAQGAGLSQVTLRLKERDRLMANIAAAAGIIKGHDTSNGYVAEACPHVPNDTPSRHLLLLTVFALHASEPVPDISSGWNGRLVPAEVIYRHTAASIEDRDRAPEKPLYITGLANRGFVVSGGARRGTVRQEKFFFSVDGRYGKAIRQLPAYGQWVSEQRFNEPEARATMEAAFAVAQTVEVDGVPKSVRLIDLPSLEELALERDLPTILSMTKLGYCLLAHADDRGFYKRKPGADGSDIARSRRYYFVAQTLAELDKWKKSARYQQWVERDELGHWLLQKWVKAVSATVTEVATFVPPEQQPAYVVTEKILNKFNVLKFALSYLSALGYISKLGLQPNYLFWPEPSKGLRYKAALQADANLTRPADRLREEDHKLWHTRLEQVLASPDWPVASIDVPSSNDFSDLRFISYDALKQLIANMPPLTISGLQRRGYLIHAGTQTRPGIGSFIVCPGGKVQAAAVVASEWYKTVKAKMRQRGFNNIVRRPEVRR